MKLGIIWRLHFFEAAAPFEAAEETCDMIKGGV